MDLIFQNYSGSESPKQPPPPTSPPPISEVPQTDNLIETLRQQSSNNENNGEKNINDPDDLLPPPPPPESGLPESFVREKEPPKDPNREIEFKNDTQKNFRSFLAMWRSRRSNQHPKGAKFKTEVIGNQPNQTFKVFCTHESLDNYSSDRSHRLRFCAENYAVRDLLDYIVAQNYMYPLEIKSYNELRNEINIESIAEKKQRERESKSQQKQKTGKNQLTDFITNKKSEIEKKYQENKNRDRNQKKTAKELEEKKHRVRNHGFSNKHLSGGSRGSRRESRDTDYSGAWVKTKEDNLFSPLKSTYTASGGAWGTPRENDRNAILAPVCVYGGSNFEEQKPRSNTNKYSPDDAWNPPPQQALITPNNYANQYRPPAPQGPPAQWAGMPGATNWNTKQRVLYPPPKWALEEANEMIGGLKSEMSLLFNQNWFLELAGDAQRIAWYNKLTQIKPRFAAEEQRMREFEERERQLKEKEEQLKNEETKRMLEAVEQKQKEKKKGGYANKANISIKDFEWKNLSKYTADDLEAKQCEIEGEIHDNKENFGTWKQQCRQWEQRMRQSGFLNAEQQKKMTETAKEWRKMEVKFIQVEEKKKSQIELLRSEAEFRNAPPPPDFFNTDIYQRPVSPIPEPTRWEPIARSPSPDADLIQSALQARKRLDSLEPPRDIRPFGRSPEMRITVRRSRSRSPRSRSGRSRDRKHRRKSPASTKRSFSTDSDVIDVTPTDRLPEANIMDNQQNNVFEVVDKLAHREDRLDNCYDTHPHPWEPLTAIEDRNWDPPARDHFEERGRERTRHYSPPREHLTDKESFKDRYGLGKRDRASPEPDPYGFSGPPAAPPVDYTRSYESRLYESEDPRRTPTYQSPYSPQRSPKYGRTSLSPTFADTDLYRRPSIMPSRRGESDNLRESGWKDTDDTYSRYTRSDTSDHRAESKKSLMPSRRR